MVLFGSRHGGAPTTSRDRPRPPEERPAVVVPPHVERPAGLGLPRLLEIARITPAQALALGADVLAGLESRHAAGGDGLSPKDVHVGPDGRARLADRGRLADQGRLADRARVGDRAQVDGHPLPETGEPDLTAVATLLDDLGGAARRTARQPDARTVERLAALDAAVVEATRPGGTVAAVAAGLRDADASGGTAARAELARLVAAVSGRGAGPAPRAAGTAARPPAPPAPAAGRAPRARARSVAARTWKWAVSLLVLVTVIAIEFAFLRDRIARDVEALLDAGRTGSTTSETSAGEPAPVVPPAPPTAGAVTAVDLRTMGPCAPGEGCEARVQVRLHPGPEPQTVDWAFQVVDRCTGALVTLPGGTVTIPPNGDRADAIDALALPPGDALAVLALTGAPDTAASAPVSVPARASCAVAAEPSR
jgi:hypothetical protein